MNKIQYRTIAKQHLQSAKALITNDDDECLEWAALKLRKAMEALTYDRAQSYSKEISPDEIKKWQPKKVMKLLLEIDPLADRGSTLAVGVENTPGEPAEKMSVVGTETVLSLRDIKDHYDALGNYLHIPTIDQHEKGKLPNLNRLRKRCEELAANIEDTINSPVWNIVFKNFSQIKCTRCSAIIHKRIPNTQETQNLLAKCFECGALYDISSDGDKKLEWTPQQVAITCPHKTCGQEQYVWRDEIESGAILNCVECGCRSQFRIGVVPIEAK